MQVAAIAGTSQTVFAPTFARLSDEQREAFSLECPGCGATAHFRRGAPGRGPCFYAKHPSCELASTPSATLSANLDEQEFTIPSGRIVTLDRRPRDQIPARGPHVEHDEAGEPGQGRARRRAPAGSGKEAETSRRLIPLLREIVIAGLADEDFMVRIGDVDRASSEFFVHITDLGPEHVDRLHGIWGHVQKVDEGDYVTWFRTGEPANLWLKHRDRSPFLTEQRLQHAHDVADHFFLLIGTAVDHVRGSVVPLRLYVESPTDIAFYSPPKRRRRQP